MLNTNYVCFEYEFYSWTDSLFCVIYWVLPSVAICFSFRRFGDVCAAARAINGRRAVAGSLAYGQPRARHIRGYVQQCVALELRLVRRRAGQGDTGAAEVQQVQHCEPLRLRGTVRLGEIGWWWNVYLVHTMRSTY